MSRTNGCQCPWKLGQATSFGVWFVVLAGCYALFIPDITDTTVQAAVIVVYTLAAIAVTCTYTIVCNINPGTKVSPTAEEETPLYCEHCQGYVSRGSKHCKECQKCIENFDHHCKWVNNCIGSRNYRSFFFLLTSMCSMFAVQLGCGVYLIIRCFTVPEASAAKLAEVYPSSIRLRDYIAALIVYTAFLALALYPLAELLLLHIVLRIRGMTTWDYIMANRQTAIEPSPLSRQFNSARRALSKITSLGSRNSRVHDISASSSSIRRADHAGHRHQRIGINPFLACVTDMDKVRSRQETGESYVSRINNADASGFDAALLYTPRVTCEEGSVVAAAGVMHNKVSAEECSHVQLSTAALSAAAAAAPGLLYRAEGALGYARENSCSQTRSPRLVQSASNVVRFSQQQDQLLGPG